MRRNKLPRLPRSRHPKNVVVIGGGASGGLIAYEAQKAGHRVTLLEKGPWGNGSSSRSAACFRAQFDNPSTVRGQIFSGRYFEQWPETVGGARSPLTQNGYLFLYRNANLDQLLARVEMQRSAGLHDVEFLSKPELDAQFPYIETTGLQGATWRPGDGFLDPSMVYTDAIEAAKKLGASTHQNAEVVSVVFDASGLAIAVRTADGREFDGDVFVNAAGVWAPEISRLFRGYPLDIKARKRYLYHLAGFNGKAGQYMSHEDFARMPMVITPSGVYARPESANGNKQLMIGGLHDAKPIRPEFDRQDDIEDGFGRDEYGSGLRKEITMYVPDAASEYMGAIGKPTTGFYEDTPDHNPLIGYDPWTRNLIHAAGFSGHGLMVSPSTGATTTLLVEAEKNLPSVSLPGVGEIDISKFAVDRVFKGGEGMVI